MFLPEWIRRNSGQMREIARWCEENWYLDQASSLTPVCLKLVLLINMARVRTIMLSVRIFTFFQHFWISSEASMCLLPCEKIVEWGSDRAGAQSTIFRELRRLIFHHPLGRWERNPNNSVLFSSTNRKSFQRVDSDSFPSLLSAGAFQTAWDVEIISGQLISQTGILSRAQRHYIHSPGECTRIQHLDHSCSIKEHSINHRCRLWVSVISLYVVLEVCFCTKSHLLSLRQRWWCCLFFLWLKNWSRLPSCIW